MTYNRWFKKQKGLGDEYNKIGVKVPLSKIIAD